MPRYNLNERDIIETLQNEIKLLRRRVTHLENNHYPTVHQFDKAALPTPLVEGMVFIATDNTFCWVRNNTARYVSGTIV